MKRKRKELEVYEKSSKWLSQAADNAETIIKLFKEFCESHDLDIYLNTPITVEYDPIRKRPKLTLGDKE